MENLIIQINELKASVSQLRIELNSQTERNDALDARITALENKGI